MPGASLRSGTRGLRGYLIAAVGTSLLLVPSSTVAQSVNSTSSTSSSVPINGVNFDFGSAAVATLVLVLLGLTALLVILAKRANRAQGVGRRQ